jgi:hypothetical protein
MTRLITFYNNRVKRFTIFDIKLIQASAMIVALILAKFIPQLLDISIWWFIAALVIVSARPMYLMYAKAA